MVDQPSWAQGQGPSNMPPHAQHPGPHPMHPMPPVPPQRQRQRKTILTHGAVGVVCLFLGVGIGAAGSSTEDDTNARAEQSASETDEPPAEDPAAADAPADDAEPEAEPEPEPEPEPEGPAQTFSDGVHLVGEDISPGEYTTPGPDPDSVWPMCYWARNSDASGEFEAIIANDNIEGPGRVTINDGEYLEASGGCDWTLA